MNDKDNHQDTNGDNHNGAKESVPQGNVDLLRTPIAQQLLTSTIPARVAFTAADGTPRIVPTWFHWTGTEPVSYTHLTLPTILRV